MATAADIIVSHDGDVQLSWHSLRMWKLEPLSDVGAAWINAEHELPDGQFSAHWLYPQSELAKLYDKLHREGLRMELPDGVPIEIPTGAPAPPSPPLSEADYESMYKPVQPSVMEGFEAAAPTLGVVFGIAITIAVFVYGIRFIDALFEPKELTPQQQAVRDAEHAENKRLGHHCLSMWDGSARQVIAQVKPSLRDPSSFEHIDTGISPVDDNGKHRLTMTYRARNGFGGISTGLVTATVDNSTCRTIIESAD